jgi:hypothetical protein
MPTEENSNFSEVTLEDRVLVLETNSESTDNAINKLYTRIVLLFIIVVMLFIGECWILVNI